MRGRMAFTTYSLLWMSFRMDHIIKYQSYKNITMHFYKLRKKNNQKFSCTAALGKFQRHTVNTSAADFISEVTTDLKF